MKNRVKQLLMCVLFSLCVMHINGMDKAAQREKGKNKLTTVGALSLGWGALGTSGFVANLKLKSCVLKQKENPQYAQKLLKYARVSRAGGFLGITPLISLIVGYPIWKIGYTSFNDTMEGLGAVVLIPATAMIGLPASAYDRYREEKDLKEFKE